MLRIDPIRPERRACTVLDLARMKQLDLRCVPWGQIALAEPAPRADDRFPRRTEIEIEIEIEIADIVMARIDELLDVEYQADPSGASDGVHGAQRFAAGAA